MIICVNEGTISDCNFELLRSVVRCSSSSIFDRGGLNGRFVSVPMMRWEASKCVRADTTWMEMKAGFSGTRMAPSLKRAYVAYKS
jgi:hypothetical protein